MEISYDSETLSFHSLVLPNTFPQLIRSDYALIAFAQNPCFVDFKAIL